VKFTTLVLVAAGALLVLGCGSGSSVEPTPEKATESGVAALGAKNNEKVPGITMMSMNPAQKAQYMRDLAQDTTYDPKKNVDLWEQLSTDKNPGVAEAAKALLEKAK